MLSAMFTPRAPLNSVGLFKIFTPLALWNEVAVGIPLGLNLVGLFNMGAPKDHLQAFNRGAKPYTAFLPLTSITYRSKLPTTLTSPLWRGEILLAPWNQIRSEKYPSLSTPVSQLWHNFWNMSIGIPPKSSTKLVLVELFLCLFFLMTRGVNQKNKT